MTDLWEVGKKCILISISLKLQQYTLRVVGGSRWWVAADGWRLIAAWMGGANERILPTCQVGVLMIRAAEKIVFMFVITE